MCTAQLESIFLFLFPQRMNPEKIRRPIHQYTEIALGDALEAIRSGTSIRQASKEYGVPRTTLIDRVHGRVKLGPRRMGPATVLTYEEERKLEEWLTHLAKTGFPQKKMDLINTVHKIVLAENRETPFKDGRPGDKWYAAFLRRHPNLALREPEGLTKSRAIITEEYIKKWFRDLQSYLNETGQADVLEDPRRILNGDETSFAICPKTGKVLAPKGPSAISSAAYRNFLEDKENTQRKEAESKLKRKEARQKRTLEKKSAPRKTE